MSDLLQIENEPTFTTRLGDDNGLFDPKIPRIGEADADVKIGGDDPSKFRSIIRASKWGGEYELIIRNPLMPLRSDVKAFDEGIITIEDATKGIQERYFVTKQKHPGLEYEVIFASQPPSEIRLDIEYSPGMIFSRQDVKDFIPGSTYAPHVPGSWAIYIPESNNEKRTGKFCHLYKPEWVDAFGQRCFVEDFQIDNGQIIIISGDWVKTAVYPIVLDPTIGHTSEGGLFYNGNIYIAVGNQNVTTDGTGGQANTLYVWTEDNSLGDVKVTLYDGEVPESARTLDNSYTIATGAQANNNWSSISVSAEGKTLSSNTDYFPVMCGESGGHQLSYDASQPQKAWQLLGGIVFADELSDPSNANLVFVSFNRYSVYLEYAPVAGGVVPYRYYYQG